LQSYFNQTNGTVLWDSAVEYSNGVQLPAGASATATFEAYLSSSSGYPPLAEWTVFVGLAGYAKAISQPLLPMEVEIGSQTVYASSHLVIFVSSTTFDWSSNIGGTLYSGSASVQHYWIGNTELGNGLLLRFNQVSGFRAGQTWKFAVAANLSTVLFQETPESSLKVSLVGSAVAHSYFVRILPVVDASLSDSYEFSKDQEPFQFGGYLLPATDSIGNVELQNGLRLDFATTNGYGYAVGQLWHVEVSDSAITVRQVGPTQTLSQCSSRGLCSASTGKCTCFDGFTGSDCSGKTNIYQYTNDAPGHQVVVKGLHYVGTVLDLQTDKSPAQDFDFLRLVAGGHVVFKVDGNGNTYMGTFNAESMTVQEGLTIKGGNLTIADSTLVVENQGIDVLDGGLRVRQTQNAPAVDIIVQSDRLAGYQGSAALQLSTEQNSDVSSSHLLLKLSSISRNTSSNTELTADRFAVVSTGATSIFSGGLHIQNPIAPTGNYTSDRSNPLFGGLSVEGGVEVLDYGVTIANGQLAVHMNPTTGSSAYMTNDTLAAMQTALYVVSHQSTYVGDLAVLAGSATDPTAYNLVKLENSGTNVLAIKGDGSVSMTNNLDVALGGITVQGGGVQVSQGGVSIGAGGLQVYSGALSVLDSSSSLSISINSPALRISQGGVNAYTQSMVELNANSPVSVPSAFNFVDFRLGGSSVFSVNGNGDVLLGLNGKLRISADGYITTQNAQPEDLNLQTAAGQTAIVTAGERGSVALVAGNASSSSLAAAGSVSIFAGNSPGAATAGSVVIQSGQGTTAGSISLISYNQTSLTVGTTGQLLLQDSGTLLQGASLQLESGIGDVTITAASNFVVAAPTGSVSVVVDGLDVKSSDDIFILGTQAANVLVRGGDSPTATGGSSSVVGGPATGQNQAGGSAVLQGGSSADITGTTSNGGTAQVQGGTGYNYGGHVAIVGGAGGTRSGSVSIVARPSSNLLWLDGEGNIQAIANDGMVTVTAASTISLSSNDEVKLSHPNGSSIVVSANVDIVAATSRYVTIRGGNASTGSDSGAISVQGGSTANGTAAGVVVRGGDSSFGIGGSVMLQGGDGAGSATDPGSGGDIILQGGSDVNTAIGGSVVIHSGIGTVAGGSVSISDGSASASIFLAGSGSISMHAATAVAVGGAVVAVAPVDFSLRTSSAGSLSLHSSGGSVSISATHAVIVEGSSVSILATDLAQNLALSAKAGIDITSAAETVISSLGLAISSGSGPLSLHSDGQMSLSAGAGSHLALKVLNGAVAGGSIFLNAGTNTGAGGGGDISLSAGGGGSTGGNVIVSSGTSSAGAAGAVSLVAARSANGKGGNLVLQPGTGSSVSGSLTLYDAAASSSFNCSLRVT
jgi:hypothetical protein